MYNEYKMIYDELCERVENGELTLEDAEIVNDYAYDLYVVDEKSNFDRFINGRVNKIEKLRKSAYKMGDISRQDETPENVKEILNKKIYRNWDDIKDLYQVPGMPYNNFNTPRKIKNSKKLLTDRCRKGDKDTDACYNYYTDSKRKIKEALGDKGQRPEERYKAGRYLKLQKAINGK